MPTRKVSSCFFYLMSSEFKAHEGNGWQTPNTRLTFGIDHAPSAIPDAPLPAGLTREESRRVYEFIQEAHGTEASERLKFIDSDASDASWAAHRATWRQWYKKLSPKVNNAIDKVLNELNTLPKTMIRNQEDDSFPELDNLISSLNPVGTELFGEYVCNGNVLKKEASMACRMLLVQTYARHKRSWRKALTTLFGKVTPDGIPLVEGVGLWPTLMKDMKGA